MNFCHENGMYDGAILVSENDKVIYKNAFGQKSILNNTPLDINTVFNTGSVAKQITGMSIMILRQQGLLRFDDEIRILLPALPEFMNDVTLRHLLTHTSGLPDHYAAGASPAGLTNRDVVQFIDSRDSLEFEPGSKFKYSNSGYVLLALAVEKITGISFPEFVHQNIFEPLEMRHSAIEIDATDGFINLAIGHNTVGDLNNTTSLCYGPGNLYSNLEDLHRWNQALYSGKLVNEFIFAEGIEPYILSNGESTGYGFGWKTGDRKGDRIIQHAGSISGFKAYLYNNLDKKMSLIMLSNHGDNPANTAIVQSIDKIMYRNVYSQPRIPVSDKFVSMYRGTDAQSTLQQVRSLVNEHSKQYYVNEYDINWVGYKYLEGGDFDAALALFEWNIESFPNSSNTYDSMGEAFLMNGDTAKSILNYTKSIKLNPNNKNGLEMLAKMGVHEEDVIPNEPISEALLENFAGVYRLEKNFDIVVSREGNSLYIQPTNQSRSQIFYAGNHRFYSKNVNAQITFHQKGNKKAKSLTLHQGGDRKAKRIR